MNKRLIKKAYKKTLKCENTRLRPKGFHGKAIKLFYLYRDYGVVAMLLKKVNNPVLRLSFHWKLAAISAQIQIVQSQPSPLKGLKKGGIMSVCEEGEEMILHRGVNYKIPKGSSFN